MSTQLPGNASADRDTEIERLVELAIAGDRTALDKILRAVQRDVYNLAVRMLGCPEDAADAAQEILMKVVTHLATFRRESAFRTWTFRIATNHLLNIRASRIERQKLTFTSFAAELAVGLADPPAPAADEADQALLVEEVKIGCTQGMLLCLDRDHRIAYVLGEVFELSSEEGATVLNIPSPTYRKRLSRAREKLREFMHGHCGLVNPGRPCRCERKITYAITIGRVQPQALAFAGSPSLRADTPDVRAQIGEMQDLERIAAIYQSHPDYSTPERVLADIRQILDGGRFSLLQ